MAISLINKPQQWARVWDTNRLTYVFSSNNYTQPNFQFQFVLQKWELSGYSTNLGTFNLYPLSGGTVEFNPAVVYQNYISYDYSASNTNLTECLNGAGKFILSVYEYYGTPPSKKVDGSQWTGEVGTPMFIYNGCQQNIPYDYIALNIDGNYKWVMSTGSTKGQYLTDMTEYNLSNTDIAFLYFLAQSPQRPTIIRYKLFWPCVKSGIDPSGPDYLGIGKDVNNDPLLTQSTTQGEPYYNLDSKSPPSPTITGICSAYYYDNNFTYDYVNTLQYYFPMGPYQLFGEVIFPSAHTNDWLYYEVDLLSGNTVMNNQPFRVYNTCKSNRYGKWQLAWLNPNGGFDCYTFDRKTEINYKLTKSTYKKKLSTTSWYNYNTYEAGERVFQSDVEQEITLRSNLLTQKEAQLLTQLSQSPRVYVNTIYNYNGASYPFGVPYIVTNTELKYEQKVNDKEIVMEIKIRPSNQNIIQND